MLKEADVVYFIEDYEHAGQIARKGTYGVVVEISGDNVELAIPSLINSWAWIEQKSLKKVGEIKKVSNFSKFKKEHDNFLRKHAKVRNLMFIDFKKYAI